jgi:hypothetical protein
MKSFARIKKQTAKVSTDEKSKEKERDGNKTESQDLTEMFESAFNGEEKKEVSKEKEKEQDLSTHHSGLVASVDHQLKEEKEEISELKDDADREEKKKEETVQEASKEVVKHYRQLLQMTSINDVRQNNNHVTHDTLYLDAATERLLEFTKEKWKLVMEGKKKADKCRVERKRVEKALLLQKWTGLMSAQAEENLRRELGILSRQCVRRMKHSLIRVFPHMQICVNDYLKTVHSLKEISQETLAPFIVFI